MAVPLCGITFNSATGAYGFEFWFEGRAPHHVLDTCKTLEDALMACDPHKERIWDEKPEGAYLMSSSAWKPGSVFDRMENAALPKRVDDIEVEVKQPGGSPNNPQGDR